MTILKTMMTSMTRIYHPFPGPCQSRETSKKLKDRKAIVKDCKNCQIEGPEKIRNSMKPLKLSEDSKKKGSESNT
jgi:hypothetical protein